MRTYDGIAHQHSSEDGSREKSLPLIANLLGFPPAAEDLRYALGFYA